jgi:hypothetical protein
MTTLQARNGHTPPLLLPTPPARPAAPAGERPSHNVGERTDLGRLRWGVRGALVLGVAASIAANVLHARPNPISQAIAAWPPLALLVTVELISRVPAHQRLLAIARLLTITVIGGIAAWVSYWHMAGVAIRYGETGASPYLLPLSVDGLVVVASISLVELGGRIRATAHHHQPVAATDVAVPAPRPAGGPSQPTPATDRIHDGPGPADRGTARRSTASANPTTGNLITARIRPPTAPLPTPADKHQEATTDRERRSRQPAADPSDPEPAVSGDPPTHRTALDDDSGNPPPAGDIKAAVAYWRHRDPTMRAEDIAFRVKRSVRQVRRYLPPPNNAHRRGPSAGASGT